ncbi:MAG: tetratricopeptide repeat protein [Acidobacteria bacterium]|nr:tetratricopeptide repeat protein [Acidobacteriota bacterium]MBV9475995.1 tetratricopeptide repeat protein [Acidobacteriota bacterium]
MGTLRETLGHYEILGPIGAGGMGEVYSARDPKLGRRVAIKILPTRLINDRDNLSRFTQEARSASALNHPNIVTIHEVGTREGAPYIVMEYIDGTDLRALIAEGPLPARKVLEIASQIADGLAAAHERGIIHRDLKPENIMVTRDGFVKILDFGLAKIIQPAGESSDHTVELETPGTNPGTILGTVGYMSPEQATGRRLDFRSDQFALGAILYELVTGVSAFEGETAIDTLAAILHKEPAPIAKYNPHIPAQLAGIIGRLLSKSPDGRYASPRDLATEVRLLRDRVAAEESGFHRSAPYSPFAEKRTLTMGAVVLALILGGALFFAWRRSSSVAAPAANAASVAGTPAQPAAKKYLAVMRFQDLSGEPNGQLVVDGFAETLIARLAHFPTIQVMRAPTSDAGNGDPAKVAHDLGANLVLTGSMMRDGNRIRVTYSVVDPATRRTWRDLIEGSVSDLFAVQDDVADSVARNLNLGTSAVRVALDPTVSQQRYLEALGHLRRYDSETSLDSAIRILDQLGESPSVQSALARAYLYKFQNTRQPQYAAAAGRAADRALAQDPQSLDVNITLGELRRQTGRYNEAIDAFLRVLSQQPNNADAVLGLAETYKASGDFKGAEASYKRAIALQPNFWGGYNKLGAFYYTQGRYADAIPQFQKVVELVPDNDRGYNNLGAMYQRLGQYDNAVRVFEQSVKRLPSSQGYSNLGTCYYFLGRYAAAAAADEHAVAITPHEYVYWRNLGDAYRWLPSPQKAHTAYERAVALSDDAIRVNPNDAYAYMQRATALAKLGRDREARVSILRALELDPRFASNAYEAAVIANIEGARDETDARIEQALRLGYNADDILRDPEFANLTKSGRLQSIIAGFRSKPREN